MQEKLSQYFPSIPNVITRIGLNIGDVILGMVGSRHRLNATVLSTEVNLVARLEATNKIFSTQCLLSENTYNQLTKKHMYAIRKLPKLLIKGIEGIQTIYELFEADSPIIKAQKKEIQDDFDQAVQLYNDKKMKECANLLKVCIKKAPQDTTIKAILNMIRI